MMLILWMSVSAVLFVGLLVLAIHARPKPGYADFYYLFFKNPGKGFSVSCTAVQVTSIALLFLVFFWFAYVFWAFIRTTF